MYFFKLIFFKPFGQTAWHVGSYFPGQELSLCPHSLEAWSPNHWTTREVLYDYILPVRICFTVGQEYDLWQCYYLLFLTVCTTISNGHDGHL